MKTIKSILASITSITLAVSTMATTVSSCGFCDYGEELPIIEGYEIAEFFNYEPSSVFSNFYVATDGQMYGLNTIIAIDNIWALSDCGYYAEYSNVWIVFNDMGTPELEDDEIVEIFEAPTSDSEELAIYEQVFYNMWSMR